MYGESLGEKDGIPPAYLDMGRGSDQRLKSIMSSHPILAAGRAQDVVDLPVDSRYKLQQNTSSRKSYFSGSLSMFQSLSCAKCQKDGKETRF
jgi:hypothetical protein